MLLAGLIVGVAISIVQTATSIQEQTLTFIPKILAVAVCAYPVFPLDDEHNARLQLRT